MIKRIGLISVLVIVFIMSVTLYISLNQKNEEIEMLHEIQSNYIQNDLLFPLQRDIRFYLLEQNEAMLSGIVTQLTLFDSMLEHLYLAGYGSGVTYQPMGWESIIRSVFLTPGNMDELNRMLADFESEIVTLLQGSQATGQQLTLTYEAFFYLHQQLGEIFQAYDDEIYNKQ